MKVLVFSDSHGAVNFIDEMLLKEKDCQTVFFLGDGMSEMQRITARYPDRKFVCVKGNNDWHSNADTEAYKYIDGVTFMACHGHRFNVRFSLRELLASAESVRADVALYGHTHKSGMYNDPVTGICAINPGALCQREYCVIEIEKGSFDISFKAL